MNEAAPNGPNISAHVLMRQRQWLETAIRQSSGPSPKSSQARAWPKSKLAKLYPKVTEGLSRKTWFPSSQFLFVLE
jgi:hypothetical protein